MDIDATTSSPQAGPLAFILRLLNDNVHIAGDVVDVGPGTWAIHGTIPVDGEVLVAEFDSYDAARDALAAIETPSMPPGRRTPPADAATQTSIHGR